MSGKLVLALIVALQVSVCLCQAPEPNQDLVDKYNDLRGTFMKRMQNAYSKIKDAVGPVAEDSKQAAAVKEYIEEMQTKPHFQSAFKVTTGLVEEVGPLVEKTRMMALGYYQKYLRDHIGEPLDKAITYFKGYLDRVLPAEN